MTIGEADAIARARAVALERGWPWREPVRVQREFAFLFFGRMRWVVVDPRQPTPATCSSSNSGCSSTSGWFISMSIM